MNNFEITKREILFSIIIIAIMFVIGFTISGHISDSIMTKQQEYNTALEIDNNTYMFKHNMETDIGNAFVYGELKAVDTVTYPDIKGKYMYVKKVKEKYTKHTETYTTTDNKGHTQVHTRTYWSWDRVGSEDIKCKEISFCGVVFKSNKINLPNSYYIDTVKKSSHIRYKYYGVGTKYKGTIYTELKNNTILDNTSFYKDKNIKEVKDDLKSSWQLVLFWVAWILFIGGVVFLFYYLDNVWLEDRK